MTKREICKVLQQNLNDAGIKLTIMEVEKLFKVVFETVKEILLKGIPLSVSSFGTFSTKLVKRRDIVAGSGFKQVWSLYFKPSDEIKKKLKSYAKEEKD